VGTATNWSSVSGGGYYTSAVKTDGTLWAWGANDNGQLGLGDTTTRNTPTQVGTAVNWLSVSSGGYHTLAVKTDGSLWAWGANSAGQSGFGENIPSQVP
jgi:alpha-tubulin suppressor-like RCC1 family protein